MSDAPAHMLGRVLRPDELLSRATYGFAPPDPALEPWVERYWSVAWRMEPGVHFRTATLSEPAVNLTLERGDLARAGATSAGTWLTGPADRGEFGVTLFGTGSVVGIKFRVGGVLAYADVAPAALHGTTVPAGRWFPDLGAQWADLPPSAQDAAPRLDAWLLARTPAEPDPAYARFRRWLDLLADPRVTRLDQLAERAGCDVRTLQRTFKRYAGVGPKWLLTRARVIDAVAALDRGHDGTLADLAHELGWFDQAHFSRDFRRVTGETPRNYQSRRLG
ncbi:helix-turn-helix domain-containing protein [Mariniluteicoccus endophyticus]